VLEEGSGAAEGIGATRFANGWQTLSYGTSPAEKCQIALRFRGTYRGETYAPAASAHLDAHELLPHSRCMRTTLVIEDDVLEAARSLAEAERKSIGEVISMLARRGLAPQPQEAVEGGFPVFTVSPGAKPITLEMVQRALEES